MTLTENMYVPALKWHQAEYQALLNLFPAAQKLIVPFITIPEIGLNIQTGKLKKNMQDYLSSFAKVFAAKWNQRPAWIYAHANLISQLANSQTIIYPHIFNCLRTFSSNAIPALPITASPSTSLSIREIISNDHCGAAIVVRIVDLMRPDINDSIDHIADLINVKHDEIDLIIDLEAPNYEPYPIFANALVFAMRRLNGLPCFRNFVVIGTAIPLTHKGIKKGISQIPRHDWIFYKNLLSNLPSSVRAPNYGDYTIVHPEFTPMDMRVIKPSGKIVYTVTDKWVICKGGAFRDDPRQMHEHCASIVSSGQFSGAEYSFGDNYISLCATGNQSYSNLMHWKKVAINHHMTYVLEELSMFFS